MASSSFPLSSSSSPFLSPLRCRALPPAPSKHRFFVSARHRTPVEELYRIFVEKNVSKDRAAELGVQRWRRWESRKCSYDWEWKVDEQVYITKGCLQVTPHGCPETAFFYAGDVVRFPKWFSATLSIDGDYEQHYRFLAYGEGEG